MKSNVLILLILLSSFVVRSQEKESNCRFGVKLNSAVNGEVMQVRLVPSAVLAINKHQLELGVGTNPFLRKDQKIWSGELNYLFFPNGREKKFNMYFITHLSYMNVDRATYFKQQDRYFFYNAGYGFDVNLFKKVYLGTNVTAGGYLRKQRSENPYSHVEETKPGSETGFNVGFQLNVGYRF